MNFFLYRLQVKYISNIEVVTDNPMYAYNYIVNHSLYKRINSSVKKHIKKMDWESAGVQIFPIVIQDPDGILYVDIKDGIAVYLNEQTIRTQYANAVIHGKNGIYAVTMNDKAILSKVNYYVADPNINRFLDITTWKQVRNFESACRINNISIISNLETPWNEALDEESNEILDLLLALNNKGFMTIESQPGICNTSIRQREYINGFMTLKNAESLMKLPISVSFYNYKVNQKKQNKIAKSLTVNGSIPLTLENNESGGWDIYTNFPYDMLQEMALDEARDFIFLKETDKVFVAIQFPAECTDTLFMDILNSLS